MSTEIIIQQKRATWADMGEAVYKQEMQLQAMAQQAIAAFELPKSMDDVPMATNQLKELKQAQKQLEVNRKGITSRFDDLATRLMQPEKSLLHPIESLSKAILDIKRMHEAEKTKSDAIANEKKRVYEYFAKERIALDEKAKKKVLEFAERCYTKALNESMPIQEVDAYIKESKEYVFKHHAGIFDVTLPERVSTTLSQDEVNEIAASIDELDTNDYADSFANLVDNLFADYHVALGDKIKAIANLQQAKETEVANIETQAKVSNVAIQLDMMSTDVVVETADIKPLKKSYEIDMPETVESVIAIMAAFSGNLGLCMPKLKVSKWFAFTPAQAATALCKVKNDDNNFDPSGITFKIIEKL